MRYSSLQQGFVLQLLLVIVFGIFLCAWGVNRFILPPHDFPIDTTFTIKSGDSLGGVAYRLAQDHYIKSPEAFKIMMLALGDQKKVSQGEYYFDAPLTSLEIALKISGKEFGIIQNRVTFPEGYTNKEMATRLASSFDGFDAALFLDLTKEEQGYLFPDTYSFSPQVTPQTVLNELKNNFENKTARFESEFANSSHTKKEIIIMASILEKEANDGEEANVIAGILWKRMKLGIALQVDAPFLFLFGKSSAELTSKDLAVDSPYNTYKYKGLPPGPINNPGLSSIDAALHPKESPYLYYLHDSEGVVHYARTYAEHLANKKKYLQ